MVAMRTAVAHSMPVANGMPLAAIGAREEVPPCCATVLGAYACRQVAPSAGTVIKLQLGRVWFDSEDATYKLYIWSHSPHNVP